MQTNNLFYQKYTYDRSNFEFFYKIDDFEFSVKTNLTKDITIPIYLKEIIVKNIGMVYLLDFAEIVLPKNIVLHPSVSNEELYYWKYWHKEIARERIYIDRLPTKLLDINWINNNQSLPSKPLEIINHDKSAIICTTGGKESLSSLYLLKDDLNLTILSLDPKNNPHRSNAIDKLSITFPVLTAETTRIDVIKMLSKKYNGSQPSGFDMGHLIFYSLLYSDQNKNVLIGNEYGANLPNTYYEGYPINHQYVKSFDLAKTINQYIHTYITPNFNYNSPFFGFYEYKIAEYFFSLNEYLPLWTSCNNFTKEKRFCGKCAKCASSFLLGLLYKDKDFLKNYFEYYLLNDLSLYKDLLSFTSIKPLDCIGDKKEVWVALYEIYSSGKDTSSDTIKFFLKEIYPSIKDELPMFKKEILSWQNTNLFNDTLIFKAVKEKML